jgi:hypothetical protein
MHASAQDRNGDLARVKRMLRPLHYRNNRMLGTLWKLPQYQMFKIDRKFINLILPHKSIRILLLKQQKEHSRAM